MLTSNYAIAAVAAGLPTAADDGSVSMTLHQVNGDGAGLVFFNVFVQMYWMLICFP